MLAMYDDKELELGFETEMETGKVYPVLGYLLESNPISKVDYWINDQSELKFKQVRSYVGKQGCQIVNKIPPNILEKKNRKCQYFRPKIEKKTGEKRL